MAAVISGDMPGDKIQIGETHISRAGIIFPYALKALGDSGLEKYVISVYGGSGVGKSEIGSLLAGHFRDIQIPSYLMSGDNYPYRIPIENDAERLSRFRYEGLKSLTRTGGFNAAQMDLLRQAWTDGSDAEPSFLKSYLNAGRRALENYLGTPEEIDFELINEIISRFKKGESSIPLKRMGRSADAIYFDKVDFSQIRILIIEWTHGNSEFLQGVDFPIYLFSTPAETLKHRLARGRDKGADSPFVSLVLEIEQEKLNSRADNAALILSLTGEILSSMEMRRRMA